GVGEGGRRGAGGGGLDHRRTVVGGTRLDDLPAHPPPNDRKASARAETPSTFLRKPTKRA
ncbi:CoA-transferase, partial [Burkholderia pseudomallei]|uniref:CoA-transferase n=1 Tax=Burkholderia pseudomallei TaxID=28450 RepID=UPI001C4BEA0F